MRTVLTALLVCGLFWGLLPVAHAEPDAGASWSAKLQCDPGGLWDRYRLPDTLPRDALVRNIPGRPLSSTSAEAEIVCGVFGREWKSQQVSTYVAFLETALFQRGAAGQPREGHHNLYIAVYRQAEDKQYRLTAHTTDAVPLRNETLDDLDFAPYKLAEGDYAFGVRTNGSFECHEDSYCSGASVRLSLFRVVGAEVRPILSTLLSSVMHIIGAAKDDWSRDHTTVGDDAPAQLSVLKTRTKGIFDWKKKKKKRPVAIFKWNGERYDLQGEDPVLDYSNEANQEQ